MTRKNAFLYAVIALVTAIIFFWNQCIWAIGLETLHNYLSDNLQQHFIVKNLKSEVNLSQNLHRNSLKLFCRFLAIGIEKANFEAKFAYVGTENPIQTCVIPSDNDRLGRVSEKYGTVDGESYKITYSGYDAVGRPVAWTEEQGDIEYKHYGVIYDSIGNIIEEYIKVEAESGSWIFESEEEILTQYRYSYDQYGNRTTSYENEIYHEVSSNPIGTIVKVVVGIVLTIFTGPAGLGLLAIQQAAILAAANFVMNMLSGADIGQALLSAVISIAANVAGRIFGGIVNGAMAGGENAITTAVTDALFSKAGGFGGMDFLFQGLSLLNDLMVDEKGNNLFKQIFGKNGDIIFSVFQTITGFLAGGIGDNSPPLGIRLTNAILSLAIVGLTYALDGKIDPYLLQGIRTILNQALSTWTELATKQAEFREALGDLAPQGYLKIQEIKDNQGNITGYDLSSTDGKFKAELTAGLKLKSITDQEGSLTTFDSEGKPVYTKYTSGNILAYDITGKPMAYIKQGTEPVWENGKITRTYLQTEAGKEYYNTKGEFEAFVPEGNEPFYNTDNRITGSYNEQNGITNIYNEKGQLDSSITPAISNGKVQGYYIDVGNTTTYTDNQGIPIWYQNTATPNNPVYFLDPFNQTISGQLLTKLDENGLIQGYIYQDFAKNEFTFYDQNGEQLLPAINPENIKQNLANVVIKLKEILTNQLDDIKEQYELTLNGSHEIDLTKTVSAIEILIDTLPLSPSVSSILLNLLVNTDDILQNIRLQNAIDAKDIQLLYDETKYTPEQIKEALNNYIANLKEQIPSRWELFKEELKQYFILPEGLSLAGTGLVGTVVAGEPTQLTKIVIGLIALGYGSTVIAQSAWKANVRYENFIKAFEEIGIFAKAQPKLKEISPPLLDIQKDLSNNNQMPQFDPEKFKKFIYAVMSSSVLTRLMSSPNNVISGILSRIQNIVYATGGIDWANLGTVKAIIYSLIGTDFLNQYINTGEYEPLSPYIYLASYIDNWSWQPVISNDTRIISINGINNLNPELVPPMYLVNQQIALKQATGKDLMVLVPLFEHGLLSSLPIPFKSVYAGAKDIAYWLADKGPGVDFLGNEIRVKLDKIFAQLPKEAIEDGITLQLYSGSFDTTLEVLNEQNYPVKAIVALGGPSILGNNWLRHIDVDGVITNPNVERLINIWGEKDMFSYIAGTGGYKEYTGSADVINIEILGIGHTDYLNNDNNPDPSSLSYKANQFMNRISQYSNDKIKLYSILNNPSIIYDPNRDLYTVDLNKLYPEDYK